MLIELHHYIIETPRSRAGGESNSVKDFFSVLFANPAAELAGIALTGIQGEEATQPFVKNRVARMFY